MSKTKHRLGEHRGVLNWIFGSHSEIIELRIWWPQPNYWIEDLVATVKLLNWEFHGHCQIIIELRISWPQPNYWIENFAATAKLLLNWEFHGHSQIIELRIWWPLPNYWIENFAATAKLLNWIGMWLWQWIFPVCAKSQNMFRSMSKWPVRPDWETLFQKW